MLHATQIEHSQQIVDLLPIAEQAISRFGLFSPKQAIWLAEFVAVEFDQGISNIAGKMRKNGTQMTAEKRKACGVGRSMMSEEMWARFEPDDTLNAKRRIEIVVGHVIKAAYKEANYQKLIKNRPISQVYGDDVLVKHWGSPRPPCQAIIASGLLDIPVSIDDCPRVPLPQCDAEECHCEIKPAWVVDAKFRKKL